MSDSQDIATRSSTEVQGKDTTVGRTTGVYLRPPADVLEDGDGITLRLDMPGVSKDRLKIQTDRNTLIVEGDVQIVMPDGMEALFAEVRSTHYRRSFALSPEIEPDKTEASFNDGVLTLRMPKRAELRPRRIEIRAG